jgi:hypothetical protein
MSRVVSMVRLGVAWGLATAVAMPARAAGPGEEETAWALDFTESLFADYHHALNDPQLSEDARRGVIDFRNRLNTRLRSGDLTLGLRLDAALFPSPPSSQYASDLRPEEVFATWRPGAWTLTLGDDYLTLGRGLALSLRKFDEIGVASSLRGAHVGWRGEAARLRFGVGTTNVVNVDLVEEKKVPDPNDLVGLARMDLRLADGVEVGVQAVHLERRHSALREAVVGTLWGDDDTDPLEGRRFLRTTLAGASLDARRLGDVLDLYLEGDWLHHAETRAALAGDVPADSDGTALYGAATLTLGQTTALLEGKRYDNWRVRSTLHPDTADAQGITQTFLYIAPPTLERIDQRVLNNTDVTGVHLRLDHALPQRDPTRDARNSLFLSGAFFVDAPARGEWTLHTYAGWERITPAGERTLLQTGLRLEEAPEAGISRLRMAHVDLDWTRVLRPGLDFQLHWNHELRARNIGAPTLEDTYHEGTLYASINFVPTWSFTGQFEYLTSVETENPWFPGVHLQYRWTLDSFVRLFVGRGKGGLKCAGGICRIFPHFEGVKLETTVRF